MAIPFVTALVDTFNYGRYIEDALASIVAQDFPAKDLEIVVVDDGSTDDTAKRVRRFGDRIRYLVKSHGGQASAINQGVSEARGSIVALLDADDLWLPNKVQTVVGAMEREPEVGLLYHPFAVWDQQRGLELGSSHFVPVSGFVANSPLLATLYTGGATSGLVFRREVLERLGRIPEGLTIMADAFLGSAAAFLAPVLAIPDRLTKYRLHGSNLYSIQGADRSRLHLKLQCQRVLVQELRCWFPAHGYSLESLAVSIHLRKLLLFAEELMYSLNGVGRWSYFTHLMEERSLHREVWSRRYSVFKAANAVCGLMLGHNFHRSLSMVYGRTKWLGALRRATAPQFSVVLGADL